MKTFESKGNFKNTERFISTMRRVKITDSLKALAQEGVNALASATPVDSGVTAASWGYSIESSRGRHTIIWTNSSTAGNTPIVIMLQYGHGTGTGGYVRGTDFINPAIQPIFDRISTDAWKVVTSA